MKLKVCGLSKIIEVQTSVNYGADFCGFILNYPKSHRFITYDQAVILTKVPKKNSKYVGVLVKPTMAELEKFSKLDLDYFQLYGNYDANEILKIKEQYKKKIIVSIQVENEEDVEKYKLFERCSDIILWDSTGYEKSLSWDFNLIKTVPTRVTKMVAGNINIKKLKDLLGLTDIIDVSGALETNKVKDIDKIKKFITEVKKINDAN